MHSLISISVSPTCLSGNAMAIHTPVKMAEQILGLVSIYLVLGQSLQIPPKLLYFSPSPYLKIIVLLCRHITGVANVMRLSHRC